MRTKSLANVLAVPLLLAHACIARAPCGAEVKLLLDPAGLQIALSALQASPTEGAAIYLYDTDSRELLAHGIILRVRLGKRADLTVKLRLAESKEIAGAAGESDRYKCEVDSAGEKSFHSYSVQTGLSGPPPATGERMSRVLSPAQTQLLQRSGITIPWNDVHQSVAIRSTSWQIPGRAGLAKLALELWEWEGGSALELSAKTSAESALAALAALRQLAANRGLTVAADQRPKTSVVLDKLP